jgi:1-acyl-sn-glycerol-3-phosphate acyltransferase
MKQSFENYVSPFLKYIDSRFRIIKVEENRHGLTHQIVEQLKYQDHYLIGLSPEGTRKCNSNLRKGFHYIAKELKIPILYMGINYDKKKISFEPLRESSTWEEDEKWFQETCVKYPPLFPDQCYWTRSEYLEDTDQERSIQSSSDSASESALYSPSNRDD